MTSFVLPIGKLAAICQEYHVTRLGLFGPALHPPFGQDIVFDLLVEFDPAHVPGRKIDSLQHALEQILGVTVDLSTPQSLHPDIRERVLESARVLYDERPGRIPWPFLPHWSA